MTKVKLVNYRDECCECFAQVEFNQIACYHAAMFHLISQYSTCAAEMINHNLSDWSHLTCYENAQELRFHLLGVDKSTSKSAL